MKIKLVYDTYQVGEMATKEMPAPRPGDYLSINVKSKEFFFLIMKVHYYCNGYGDITNGVIAGEEDYIKLYVTPGNALANEHIKDIIIGVSSEENNL